MFFMEYMIYLVLVLVVFSVVILGFSVIPYHGVISLMGTSFLCCLIMIMIGRTYAALVMYIVYLGGLIVIFGYCVSVEKGKSEVKIVSGLWYFLVAAGSVLVVWVMVWVFGGMQDLMAYTDLGGLVNLEVNGTSVFYFSGGAGLVICAWGLIVALFSVMTILGWTRKGGMRSF